MKVAIYARYSSENQRDASIADQFRVCREFAQRQGWHIAKEYSDHAVSGARRYCGQGSQAMMASALRKEVDIVLAESLDRFSRDQEDTAGLFKRLTFAGVSIVTLAEGDITFLHIGLKGTMNAMFLKELADKTRRGLRGRIELGKAGGGVSFGYRIVRRLENGVVTTGEREIVPGEAAIVRRIFKDYMAGASPKQIAKALNAEGVPGPRGALWSPSTIHGNPERGIGILHNELYIGRLVWNRQRFLKDPDTGKRVARTNPPSERSPKTCRSYASLTTSCGRPCRRGMRALSESGRQPRKVTVLTSSGGRSTCSRASRNVASAVPASSSIHASSSDASAHGAVEVEQRVLRALQDKLMRKQFFEEFCRE
jgi:site-specific DNA recombinase